MDPTLVSRPSPRINCTGRKRICGCQYVRGHMGSIDEERLFFVPPRHAPGSPNALGCVEPHLGPCCPTGVASPDRQADFDSVVDLTRNWTEHRLNHAASRLSATCRIWPTFSSHVDQETPIRSEASLFGLDSESVDERGKKLLVLVELVQLSARRLRSRSCLAEICPVSSPDPEQ